LQQLTISGEDDFIEPGLGASSLSARRMRHLSRESPLGNEVGSRKLTISIKKPYGGWWTKFIVET
jgi:hypothetical protein